MCSSVAPELFSTDTGVVALKKEPASYSDDDKKLAQEAASACPNGVIEIADT
jgi:ferredoxin